MAPEIETSTITVGPLSAYLARPAGGSRRGMLLLPMITGIGKQVREYAHQFAERGITALTWDPWHGPSSDDTPPDRLKELLDQLDDETSLDEQIRLLDHLLGELGCAKAGVIGWCLGGRFALLLAGRDQRPASAIAYHPTVPGETPPNHTADAIEHCSRITAPVMMLYPGADSLVPHERFAQLQAVLQARETGASIIHVYPGAEHGFSNRTRHGNPVNVDAYALSWPQVLDFADVTTA
ncbi:dienelactone hydrolase family protein [Saccharothrix sp. AJ9571]|nr:dienelactone hydrolase family protein [Saccharothrix sp. AJ9571]